jgi:probable phosphomutase (TIGR03848 family)
VLLLLVRHGITDLTASRLVGRTPGVHLSPKGQAQAAAVAARTRELPLAAVYSSPLERALETAAPVVSGRALEVQIEPALIEVDYGDWTGAEFKALRRTELWRRVQERPADARFPGGEAMREVQTRAVGGMERLAAAHPKQIVVAVSHGDVIKALVAHAVGLHLDLFQRIVVNPGSITALLVGDRVPRLLRLNDSGDLDDLRPPRRPPGGGGPKPKPQN